jgi:Fe-S-cluster containining protein
MKALHPDSSSRSIKSGESYLFECTSCGECCRGDIRISLNLSDLRRMAAFLGFESTGQLFTNGWVAEESLEKGGFRPFIRFREKPLKFCPFLENRLEDSGELLGRCKLHPANKPLVCALAPLGREVQLPDIEEWYVIEPIEGCPGCRKSTACALEREIAPLRADLHLEISYFKVMKILQNAHAPLAVFRRFHQEFRVGETVNVYLNRWLDIAEKLRIENRVIP